MIDISVIVPVYNVETLLPRCVDSILAQTKKEIEIILVNDGSTDHSGDVCEEYAKKQPNVRVIHQKNGGLTCAWKAGVKISQGRYLGFVDSDDWIEKDMYQKLWDSVEKYHSDLVVCGLVFDYEDPGVKNRTEISGFTREFYDRSALEQEFPKLINDGHFFGRTLQPARVTKLYKRQLVLENMELCNERVSVGEDLQLTLPVLLDADSMSVVQNFYPYHYWYNQNSMTGKHDVRYLEKIKIMKESLEKISQEKGAYDFQAQLVNDFLGLAVIGIKNAVIRNQEGYQAALKEIQNYCQDEQVCNALETHTMDQLPITIRGFLWLMKHRAYRICYGICKLFFRS